MRQTADVVVIGGGCMGVSVAYHLARTGMRDVVVVEREAMLGAGSTGRCAGGARLQFSHASNIRLSLESIAMFERFEEELGQSIDFRQDGYLFLLSTPESVAAFRRNADLQASLGVPVEWLDPDEAMRRSPGTRPDGILAATFCGRDGIADPNGVTMGFAKAAQRHGVEIVRETEVTGIETASGRIAAVATARGPIATPVVVNAAGPWSQRIGALAGLDVPVQPIRRHIFIADVPPDPEGTPLASRRSPANRILTIDFDTSFYFHREGTGILFGMGDPDEPPGFDQSVNWDFLERVTPVAERRLPVLAEAGISRAWAGLYEMTPDAMPILGPAPQLDGFHLITGFSGHGFQHAPAAGRIVADLITGRDPGDIDLAPFRFARFADGETTGEGNVV